MMVFTLFFAGCGDDVERVQTETSGEESEEAANQPVIENLLDDDEDELALPEDTFSYDVLNGYHGRITLLGYVSIRSQACEDSEDPACSVQKVSFNFDRSDSEAFRDFMDQTEGGAFVGKSSVTLGCYEEDHIAYTNFANTGETPFEGEIAGDELTALMASRQESPVHVTMEKSTFTFGEKSTACMSWFRDFDVLEAL